MEAIAHGHPVHTVTQELLLYGQGRELILEYLSAEAVAAYLAQHFGERELPDPLAQGFGPLTAYLDTLQETVERVAAGQFTRESIAVVKNQQFIDYCELHGYTAMAALYRDTIQKDEAYHHQLGRQLLLRLATTPEAQERATQAAQRTLELAEELQHLALTKMGVHHAPGC